MKLIHRKPKRQDDVSALFYLDYIALILQLFDYVHLNAQTRWKVIIFVCSL